MLLSMVAGIGYLWMGNVNFTRLGLLLIGSIPGILIGSLPAMCVTDGMVRPFLAIMRFAIGLKTLLS